MVVLSLDLTNLSFENARLALVDVRGSVKAIFIRFFMYFSICMVNIFSQPIFAERSHEIYEIIDWCALYFQANFTILNS